MAKIGMTVMYEGQSGKEYTFDTWEFPGEWNSVAGVYLITKRYKNKQDSWTHALLYVGETGDLKDRMSNHHKQDCFDENNANCLCWLGEESESKRLAIEDDIYKKWGPECND